MEPSLSSPRGIDSRNVWTPPSTWPAVKVNRLHDMAQTDHCMERALRGDLLSVNFEGHRIRVHIDVEGKPWWIAKDVCEVLHITNVSKAVSRLKEAEKRRLTFIHGVKLLLIDEAGLYRLLCRSNQPEAEKLKEWLLKNVRR